MVNPCKILILLFICLLSVKTSASQTVKNEDGWIPFILQNNHIVIDISINGIPTKAIIDSGSELNVINKMFIDKQATQAVKTGNIKVSGISSTNTLKLYSNIPISVFGFKTKIKPSPSSILIT